MNSPVTPGPSPPLWVRAADVATIVLGVLVVHVAIFGSLRMGSLLSIGELALRGDVSCLGILQPCFDSGNVEVVGASGIMFRGGNQGSEVGRKEYELL